jgi:hypothetical protein
MARVPDNQNLNRQSALISGRHYIKADAQGAAVK